MTKPRKRPACRHRSAIVIAVSRDGAMREWCQDCGALTEWKNPDPSARRWRLPALLTSKKGRR